MSKLKATPGPWHVPKSRGYAHGPVDRNDVPVVTWTGMARPRQENGMANAHLIAAAPELAEYIKEKADNGCEEAARLWRKCCGDT